MNMMGKPCFAEWLLVQSGGRGWQIDGRRARGARCMFCFIHKHKAPFYLCINKLYSIHFSVVSSVGIQSFMEEANLSKVPAFYGLERR